MTTVHNGAPDAVSTTAPRARGAHPLLTFLAKRVAITAGLLLGVTVVTFGLVNVVPGDPVTANLSDQALNDPAAVAAFRQKWGLDQPLWAQYLHYLGNLLHGDLGQSQQTGRAVLDDLLHYVPATLELAIPSMVLALLIGTGIGMLAAIRNGRLTDQLVRVGALLGLSTPPFWLSLVVLYVFFYQLGLAPSGGRLSPDFSPPPTVTGMYTVDAALAGQWDVAWDAAQHLSLPVLVLTSLTVAMLVRFVRSAMLEVLQQDYIRAAYAKGLPTRVVLRRHLLRAGLVPVVTVSGLAFASLLSGTVLVESIFGWPGVGQYAYRSATALDLPAILGVSLFVAMVYTLVNLTVDLLYGLIDPRIRLS
ncbi:peptide/nickel transport system permease protein [Micromonospora coriariae]|uniref:Peptide/nickel transport system permease protein n=1 Tax=Micromonospora coriariae TaxID=285665 RepID=A0A1C4XGI9_9ACTN|nr:ABC transporter permease [Micromonospora coriariae]SCF07477.1 peptide/nickel transport system permease protein [Micromonospora coriariae]